MLLATIQSSSPVPISMPSCSCSPINFVSTSVQICPEFLQAKDKWSWLSSTVLSSKCHFFFLSQSYPKSKSMPWNPPFGLNKRTSIYCSNQASLPVWTVTICCCRPNKSQKDEHLLVLAYMFFGSIPAYMCTVTICGC